MPFRRRVRRRRRRRARRPRRRTFRRMRHVRMDPEQKSITIAQASLPIALVGLFAQPTIIDQGVDSDNRIGRKAVFTQFDASFLINSAATPLNGTVVKIWLIHDKTPNGVQFPLADFLASPGLPHISHRNLNKTNRLRVLWSKTISWNALLPSRRVVLHKRLRVTTTYQGTGNGITDITTGGITLLLVSNRAVLANMPLVDVSQRIRFVG